jgi:hypothetical protein
MENMTRSDSPVARRIVLSFLAFLNSGRYSSSLYSPIPFSSIRACCW